MGDLGVLRWRIGRRGAIVNPVGVCAVHLVDSAVYLVYADAMILFSVFYARFCPRNPMFRDSRDEWYIQIADPTMPNGIRGAVVPA